MLICDINPSYRGRRQSKKFILKVLSLFLIALLIFPIISGIFLFVPSPKQVQAATQNWSFTTANNYTYDDTKIEFSSGQAQLKATSTWYGTSWSYRKKITIDNTKVNDDLTDFPVLVSTTSDSDLSSNAQENGDDILFTQSDGTTKLSHEIEKYASSTGELAAWVKSDLASTTNTEIYIYYGYPGASDQQQATSVWDSNYMGVWHLNETSGTRNDSTSKGNNLTETSGTIDSSSTDAIAGNSADFEAGDTEHLLITDAAQTDLDITGPMTLSAWIKAESQPGGWRNFLSDFANPPSGGWYFAEDVIDAGHRLKFRIQSASDVYGSTTLDVGTWYYVNAVYNGTKILLYVNGEPDNTPFSYSSGISTSSVGFSVGNKDSQDQLWGHDGLMDEVRISSTTRSAAWISTSYNNQTSSSAFYSLGAQIGPYDTNNPTIQPTSTNALTFTSLSAFTETATKNGGEIKYVLSNDAGTTWYYYNSGWTTSDGSYSQANTATEINTNIGTFPTGSGSFLFKAFLHSDGTQLVQLDGIEVAGVPSVPSIGTPTVLSSTSIRWSFTDTADDETGFYLYDSTDTLVASSATVDLSYLNETGLSENTQYSGRYVKAYNGYGNSASSSAASAVYTLADTPTNLGASADTNSIALSVDSFLNDTSASSGYYFSGSGANSGWIQTNSWQDNGLSCGTSYAYSVKYRNGDGTETNTISLTKSTDSCGGGGSSLPSFSSTGRGNISQNLGGKIRKTFESGNLIKVEFPPKSTKGTIVVEIEPQDKTKIIKTHPLPQNKQIVGDLVADFKALSGGRELEKFEKEVQITFTYSDEQAEGVNEKTLKVYWWNESTETWQILKSSKVDLIFDKVTASTLHFTLFAVIGETGEKLIEEMTIEELRARIAEILASIAQIQAKIAQLKGEKVTEIPSDYQFAKYLFYDQRSDDVRYLQMFLKSQGSDVYPQGLVTGYFGPLTNQAVINFQLKHGIITLAKGHGAGYVGPKTRAKINLVLGK